MPPGIAPRDARARRFLFWTGLAALVGLSWLYLVSMNVGMSAAMSAMARPAMAMRPGWREFSAAFLMWTVMMAAMMGPTLPRMLSLFMDMTARRSPGVSTSGRAAAFAGGYFVVWTGFAAIAAVAQTALMRATLLTPMAQSASAALSAGVLLAAGAFQFTALKEACLVKCRTPLGFLLAEWRDGAAGAFAMGLDHGRFCVGCCWALMAVMFVVGAMNLLWMATLTVVVLGEKLAPPSWRLRHAIGATLLGLGIFVAAGLVAR